MVDRGDPFYLKFLSKLTQLQLKRLSDVTGHTGGKGIWLTQAAKHDRHTSSSAIAERPHCRVG